MKNIAEELNELLQVKDARIKNLLETIEIMKKTIQNQEENIAMLMARNL